MSTVNAIAAAPAPYSRYFHHQRIDARGVDLSAQLSGGEVALPHRYIVQVEACVYPIGDGLGIPARVHHLPDAAPEDDATKDAAQRQPIEAPGRCGEPDQQP
jgi:hypothetical protein